MTLNLPNISAKLKINKSMNDILLNVNLSKIIMIRVNVNTKLVVRIVFMSLVGL
jgi:hypothetical protein